MELAALSNVFYIVVLAYIAAFMPWTAFIAKDFISDKWKSIRHTRQAGYINLLFAIVPACYILFYCRVQFAALDWKEGFAAVAALVFALLHGVRSGWGLWQLYLFRSWCADSIEALEAMGVTYRYYDENRRGVVDKHCKSAWKKADEMLVNNRVVDNQILNGEAVCHIEYGNNIRVQAEVPYYMEWRNAVELVPRYLVFLLKMMFCFGAIVLEGIRFSMGLGTSGKVRQVPNQPVEVWMNWVIVFAAQGLGEWLSGFKVGAKGRRGRKGGKGRKGVREWEKRRMDFASEVLATCIMQLWPEVEGGIDGKKGMEPMFWSGWEEGSEMHRGRMVKEELLKYAMRSGEGLPFGVAHEEVLKAKERTGGEVGYNDYGRQIVSKVGSLDVRKEFWPEIGKLDVEMLEWLTILLYMGRRSVKLREGRASSSEDDSKEDERSESGGKADRLSDSEDESVEDWVDQASRNLSEQLSRPLGREAKRESDEDGSGVERGVVLPSFPFSTRWKRARGRNRHVLKVGEMVDAWLSMIGGDGLRFVLELNEKWSTACRGVRHENGEKREEEEGDSNECIDIRNVGGDRDQKDEGSLRNVHKEVEKLRLQFQFGDEECRCEWGVNFGMTFMGYKMESVRSRLAAWAYQKDEKREEGKCSSAFRRGLGELEGGVQSMSRPFVLSKALSLALGAGRVESNLKSRQLHVRLLWELQEHLEECIQGDEECGGERVAQHGPESFEAIALCVLSFPSLRVDVEEEEEDEESGMRRTREWCGIPVRWLSEDGCESMEEEQGWIGKRMIVFEPVCGPQRCQVRVRLDDGDSDGRRNAVVSICFGEEREFVWEWWREAFTGRLEGMREWQSEHYMETSLSVIRSYGAMDSEFERYETVTKEEFEVWKGWRPFRAEICMFEMQGSGLLKESAKIQHEPSREVDLGYVTASFGFRKHKRRVVTYEEAEKRVLFHGMSLIRESIVEERKTGENDVGVGGEAGMVSTPDDLVWNAERLSRGEDGEGDVERALLLYEAAVGEFGNEEALEKCVDLILRSSRVSDTRAVEVVRMFAGNILPNGKLSERRMSSGTLEAVRGVVFKTCKKLVFRCEESMEESGLSELLSLVALFGTWEARKDARSLMDVMFCYSATFEAAFEYTEMYDIIRHVQNTNSLEAGAVNGEMGERDVNAQNSKYEVRFLERAFRVTSRSSCLNELGNLLCSEMVGVPADAARAKELYERAIADGGHVDAMYNLGVLLNHGADGVAADAARAKVLYERAIADGGHVDAMYNLGVLLKHGADGVAADAARAKELYERAIADGGHVGAMYNLGVLLKHGADGVAADAARATELYERAIADGGHVRAMYNLGVLLEDGADGVAADAVHAKELYERAIADGGHVRAMVALGLLLVNGADGVAADAARAKVLYERAIAEGGHVDAMYNLGVLLEDGADGVAADAARAKVLYERAIADGGHVDAMYNLGVLLKHGADGVAADAARAKELYERAIADGGDVYAMSNLGLLLVNGADGVAADAARAKELYERAIADGGHVGAMVNLGVLLVNGADGVEADAARAKELYERAIADGGHFGAMVNLGVLLVNGADGVAADAARAKELYERAIADGGDVLAMVNLGVLLKNGADGVAADAARAKCLFEAAIAISEDVDAMVALGELLVDGAEDVEGDAVAAQELFERAIERNGSALATLRLGELLLRGAEGVPQDVERGSVLVEQAHEILQGTTLE